LDLRNRAGDERFEFQIHVAARGGFGAGRDVEQIMHQQVGNGKRLQGHRPAGNRAQMALLLNPSDLAYNDVDVESWIGGTHCNGTNAGGSLTAWMLIVALLMGGLPILTGVVVIADNQPAFSLDICHPIAGASYNLDASLAPLIPTPPVAQAPAAAGFAYEVAAPFCPQLRRAPDPPPPKMAA
jgi:hypothetical protein